MLFIRNTLMQIRIRDTDPVPPPYIKRCKSCDHWYAYCTLHGSILRLHTCINWELPWPTHGSILSLHSSWILTLMTRIRLFAMRIWIRLFILMRIHIRIRLLKMMLYGLVTLHDNYKTSTADLQLFMNDACCLLTRTYSKGINSLILCNCLFNYKIKSFRKCTVLRFAKPLSLLCNQEQKFFSVPLMSK